MSVWLEDWAGSLRSGVVTLLATVFILSGSMIFASFQGHASDADLVKVDEASKTRDAELRRVLERHLEDAKEERERAALDRERQAEFRGAVAAKLKILLPME